MQQYSRVSGKNVINVYSGVFAARFKPGWMQLDNEAVRGAMVRGTNEYFRQAGKTKGIVGLSGGLDSAVAAQVLVEALGRGNVLGVAMPYVEKGDASDSKDWQDAYWFARHLGIEFITRPITHQTNVTAQNLGLDPFRADLSPAEINRLGNIKARQRMIALMDLSAERDGLVVGTGNKSERMVGYCTIWGDTACAVNPLGNIYKTQEYEFARFIGIPDNIVSRTPSAGLFAGQTDEGQMGFRYSELDPLCFLIFDEGLTVEQVVEFGFTKRFAARVLSMHRANEFKLRMPPIISLPAAKEKAEW